MSYKELDPEIKKLLNEGMVIPAHPLALDKHRKLDEKKQRALTRYYLAAGAGGVAVGVHTTQFEIRDPAINLLEPVFKMAAEEIENAVLNRSIIKVAGIAGSTTNALKEAELAVKYGYHLGLVSMGGLPSYSEKQLIDRLEKISHIIPIFGFYLQPAAGGRLLSYEFWRDLVDIPNVFAIKIAAFNRYQTLDVVRAVCGSARKNDIALYTGNDDNIVADLLTPYRFNIHGEQVEKEFVGGLLGHWAVWTRQAVKLFNEIRNADPKDGAKIRELLAKGVAVTDMNAVIFDAKNSFHGCIPGIHEVLRRQGLLEGLWCLDPEEKLSEGQMEEIDRIYKDYPEFTDDEFVSHFLNEEKKYTLNYGS
jgi:dihydrodipicolinate synthase/N-acetylneuraminate lyase